jgi:phosphatidylinositol glycan class V
MYCCTQSRFLVAAVWFSAATSVRSNGILYAGFFLWNAIHDRRWVVWIKSVICMGWTIAPFVLFQWYGYQLFCIDHARPWCSKQWPLLYSFVQEKYWNVGLLRYYQVQQLPNFLLAAPVLIANGIAFVQYIRRDPQRIWTLGFKYLPALDGNDIRTLPYFYLAVFMYLYCALVMHVQVILRFFTSQPFLYWFLATHVTSRTSRWYMSYSIIYSMIGACLFSVFLPPA